MRLVQRFSPVPVVLTVHGGDIFAFQGFAGRLLKRLALRRAEASHRQQYLYARPNACSYVLQLR